MDSVSDIRAAIRARGFESDTASQQLVAVNDVQRDIVGEHRWRFMVVSSTVAAVVGTAGYALPSSPPLQSVESIRLASTGLFDNPELEWVDPEELLSTAAANQGLAGVYTSPVIWSDTTPGNFTVYPAPSVAGTFTVRYLREVAELTADGDVPLIPEPYRELLVVGACKLLAQRQRRNDDAALFQGEFDRRLAAMKGQYGLRQRQTAHRVRHSGRYDWS